MKWGIRVLTIVLSLGMLRLGGVCFAADSDDFMPFEVDALSAVLMDAESGKILYAKNADEALPPASVTKIMTLLLVMEAVEEGRLSYDSVLSVSEYAASMGGSQVYLKAGEEMRLDELLKCVVVASANDAAVALAEAVSGSEEAFVKKMNERAEELGMEHTHFENVTGLDDDTSQHLISAEDIAIMSRALLRHEKILEYTTIWMDSIRDGAFGLTNTNRLIRFYNGATGLKTGSTSRAKFCISATARRDHLHLIAVIMGAPTRDIRNDMAKRLLDWGFSNYAVYENGGDSLGNVSVKKGTQEKCAIEYGAFQTLVARGEENRITFRAEVPETLTAPIHAGDVVGKIIYSVDGNLVGESDVTAAEDVDAITFFQILYRLLSSVLW